MSDATTIEWTDATFNPWWGCTKVSPGCDHCYAERDSQRFAPGLWGVDAGRRLFGEKHWNQPFVWNARAEKAQKRMRVFCASMADVFDNHPDVATARSLLWGVIKETPWLDWQLLTKRVGNVAKMVPPWWMRLGFPPNVWMGISVVNQEEADRDAPKLLELPARVRFLSCEPLLGPIDLTGLKARILDGAASRLGWVIVGGESGPKARPMNPLWVQSLRNQCVAAGVPFLFKQWGEWGIADVRGRPKDDVHWWANGGTAYSMLRIGKKRAGRELDGRTWDQYPEVRDAAPV